MKLSSIEKKEVKKEVLDASVLIAEQGDAKLFRCYGWNFFIVNDRISFFFRFGEEGEKIKIESQRKGGEKERFITLLNKKTRERKTYLLSLC